MKKIISKWHYIVIIGFLLFAAGLFLGLGENSIISVHDNLDLFTPQYKMMKDNHQFFGPGTMTIMLGGISRDYLPSEFSIHTFLYILLPPYYAYIATYLLKIVIAILGAYLLAHDILKDKTGEYKKYILLTGFGYGLLNLFPEFSICFASVPLLVLLLRKIVNKDKLTLLWYVLLFLYPLVSYFSYFGLFILGYMALYFLYRCIKYKRFAFRMFMAIIVLSLGFVACEYRLFMSMLFTNVESIRSEIFIESFSATEIFKLILEGIGNGDMHTEGLQYKFVLPVCMIFMVIQAISYIKKKEGKKILSDPLYLVFLFILFNATIYGLFYCAPVRNLFDKVLKPLAGFQFSRTNFFNPFLWYVELFIVIKRIIDYSKTVEENATNDKGQNKAKSAILKLLPAAISLGAIFVTLLSPVRYNDILKTCVSQYHLLRSGENVNELSYKEYYSEELFKKALEDINYYGEWSAAYGFHPAVLEYNGIKTIDGYLGYYPTSYKRMFRRAIAPALERVPESASYYDNWGARCYLYSGTYATNVTATRNYDIEEEELFLNTDEFKRLDGRYIFSRVKLTNAEEAGFTLVGEYEDESSPYKLYVYRTTSRYVEKEHCGIPFEDRIMPEYDYDLVVDLCEELSDLALSLTNTYSEYADMSYEEIIAQFGDEGKVLDDYNIVTSNLLKIESAYAFSGLLYYQDVSDDTYAILQEEIYADYLDLIDKFYASMRDLANSPYSASLEKMIDKSIVESFRDYEDMTDEEKERSTKQQSLKNEYEQAVAEEYYYEFEGEEWDINRLYENANELSEEDYFEIYYGIYSAKAAVVGEIYKELVLIRNEIAEAEDFDNYSEYAYASNFVRDYTPEDVKAFCKEIKKSGSLYVSKTERLSEEYYEYDPGDIVDSARDTYEILLPYFEDVDSELAMTLQYMLANNLFDMEYLPNKPSMGYTTNLDYYGDAYIFDSPYQDVNDLYTLVHEFGHYNAMFRKVEQIFEGYSNMDVSEIQSQGLECLFTEYYSDIYGEELGAFLEIYEIQAIMNAIISGSINAEFEIYVYEHPDATIEELGAKYKKIYEEYGYRLLGDSDTYYAFIDITHLFEQPGYYISYATSGLSALEIYNLSHKDRNKAKEIYMQITAFPSSYQYCEAVEYVGLSDIFSKGESTKILKEAYEYLKVKYK